MKRRNFTGLILSATAGSIISQFFANADTDAGISGEEPLPDIGLPGNLPQILSFLLSA